METESLVVAGLLNKIANAIHHKIAYYIQQNLWQRITLINILLMPLSCLYLLAHYIRYDFYQRPRKFNSKIICVGNAIVGGTGKTPFVIKLCQLLKARNKKIAIVAKGYKGSLLKNNNAIKINKTKHKAEESGDEALLLAEYAPTYIAKNRELAVAAAEKDGAEIIMMDDGLQDNKVEKDLSILIQPTNLKNHLPLPAGPMRELLFSVLYKADIIITDDLKAAYLKSFPQKLLIEQKQSISNAKYLKRQYFLLCCIAHPERVEQKLAEHDIIIKEKFFFPDHHLFTDNDLNKIYEAAKGAKCTILTTSKDFIRIPNKFHKKTEVIQLDLIITSDSKLGADVIFNEQTFKIGKKLINKLWNAAKFYADQNEGKADLCIAELQNAIKNNVINMALDKWILASLYETIAQATTLFKEYAYSHARRCIEDFFWNDLCDNYLELVKKRVYDTSRQPARNSALQTLGYIFNTVLKLFSPYLPHITEEINIQLFKMSESVNKLGAWPDQQQHFNNQKSLRIGQATKDILAQVRKYKSQHNLPLNAVLKELIISGKTLHASVISDLQNASHCQKISFTETKNNSNTEDNSYTILIKHTTTY